MNLIITASSFNDTLKHYNCIFNIMANYKWPVRTHTVAAFNLDRSWNP